MNLYKHQDEGIKFLTQRSSAMLCDEMGLGKTRQALIAAYGLYMEKKIGRVVVFSPAAVKYSWRTEIEKLAASGLSCQVGEYDSSSEEFTLRDKRAKGLPVVLVSYSLLPQERHVDAISIWASCADTLMICDESSFLKNRTAKQTKGALSVGKYCVRRWLLTGTPIANSPLDLWAQGCVMGGGINGPLKGFSNWYHFRSRYAILKTMKMGSKHFQQVVDFQNIGELTKSFAPYVLRREKKDCLDLPAKTYEVREVALAQSTWTIYQELRKEALLCLPDKDVRPEPNAAVRILRLCQLTSGHVGTTAALHPDQAFEETTSSNDVSSEKLDWLVNEITVGELSGERALIVWCRWRRERERLAELLRKEHIAVEEIYGGQTEKQRASAITAFEQKSANRVVLLGQQRAGGYGLTLVQAAVAVYCSNDFSYTGRIQSEDRCHRIGQHRAVTYVDVLATGPKGQKTIDHYILECLREKRDLAETTCSGWRKALNDE